MGVGVRGLGGGGVGGGGWGGLGGLGGVGGGWGVGGLGLTSLLLRKHCAGAYASLKLASTCQWHATGYELVP